MKHLATLVLTLLGLNLLAQQPFEVWQSPQTSAATSPTFVDLRPADQGIMVLTKVANNGHALLQLKDNGDPIEILSPTPSKLDPNNASSQLYQNSGFWAVSSFSNSRNITVSDGSLAGSKLLSRYENVSTLSPNGLITPTGDVLEGNEDYVFFTSYDDQTRARLSLDYREQFENAFMVGTEIMVMIIDRGTLEFHAFDPKTATLQFITSDSYSPSYLITNSAYFRLNGKNLVTFDGTTKTTLDLSEVPEVAATTGDLTDLHDLRSRLYFQAPRNDEIDFFEFNPIGNQTQRIATFPAPASPGSMPLKRFKHDQTYAGIASGNRVILHNRASWITHHDFTNLADVYADTDGVWVIESTDDAHTFDVSFMATQSGQVTFVKTLTDVYLNPDTQKPGPFTAANGRFYYVHTDPAANDTQRLAWFTRDNPTNNYFQTLPTEPTAEFELHTTDLDQQIIAIELDEQLYPSTGYQVAENPLPEDLRFVKGLAPFKGDLVVARSGGLYQPGASAPFRPENFASGNPWNPFSLQSGQDRLLYMANRGSQSHLISDNFPLATEVLTQVPGENLTLEAIGQYQGKYILIGNDLRAYAWDADTQTLETLLEERYTANQQPVLVGDQLCFQVSTQWPEPRRLGFLSLVDQTITEIELPTYIYHYYSALNLVSYNDAVWFTFDVDTETERLALWTSDGTEAGTRQVLVADTLHPEGRIFEQFPLLALQDRLMFVVRDQSDLENPVDRLYATQDGSSFDLVLQFGAGTFPPWYDLSNTRQMFATFQNQVYFVNHTAANGTELWVTDGTAAQTQLFFEGLPGPLNSGIRQLEVRNQTLYWQALAPGSPTYSLYGYRTTPDASFTTDYSFCLNGGTQSAEAAFNQPGATYAWTINGGQILGDHTARSVDFEVNALTAELSLTVTYNGSSVTNNQTLNVNDVPTSSPNIAGPTTFCSGVMALYDIVDPDPASEYTWEVTGGTILRSVGESHQIQVLWQAGNGSVALTESTACGSAPATTLNVTVEQGPSEAFAGADQNLCDLTQTQLQANQPAVGSGAWQIISGTGGNLTDPADPQTAFTGQLGQAYELLWTVSNGSCTSNSDSVRVRFTSGPGTANAGGDLDVCGDSVTLSANAPTSGVGYWQMLSGSGGSFSDLFDPNATFHGVQGRVYDLQWTLDSEDCGSSSDHLSVAFRKTPASDAGDDLCSDTAGINLHAATLHGTGMWHLISGPDIGLDQIEDLAAAQTRFTPMGGEGTYVLQWRVINNACSEALDEVRITVRAPNLWQAVGQPFVGADDEADRYIGLGEINGRILFASRYTSFYVQNPEAIWAYDPSTGTADFLGHADLLNNPKTYTNAQLTFVTTRSGYFATDGTLAGTRGNIWQNYRLRVQGFFEWQGQSYVHRSDSRSYGNLFPAQINTIASEPLLPTDAVFTKAFTTDSYLFALANTHSTSTTNQWLMMDASGNIERGEFNGSYDYDLLDYYNEALEMLPYLNGGNQLYALDLYTGESTPLSYLNAELTVWDSVVFNDLLYLLASHPDLGTGIYRTNGFPNTVELVTTIEADAPYELILFNNQLVWREVDGLYYANGSIGDRHRFFTGHASHLTVEGATLWFFAGEPKLNQVWRSDLSEQGTQQIWQVPAEDTFELAAFKATTEQALMVVTQQSNNFYTAITYIIDLTTQQSFDPLAKDIDTSYITGRGEHQVRFGTRAAFRFKNDVNQQVVGIFNASDQSLAWHPQSAEPLEFHALSDQGFIFIDSLQRLHIYVNDAAPAFQIITLENHTWTIVDNQLMILNLATETIDLFVAQDGELQAYSFAGDALPALSDNNSEIYYLEGNWLFHRDANTQQHDFIFDHTTLPYRNQNQDVRLHIWDHYAFFHYGTTTACVDLTDFHLLGTVSMSSSGFESFAKTKGWRQNNRVSFFGESFAPTAAIYQIDETSRLFDIVSIISIGQAFWPRAQIGTDVYGVSYIYSPEQAGFARFTSGNRLELLMNQSGASLPSRQMFTFGNELFFPFEDTTHGSEWWVSDGTANGTRLLQDLNPGRLNAEPHFLEATDQYLFFEATVGRNRLWVYDGFCVSPLIGDAPNERILFYTFLGQSAGQFFFKGLTASGDLEIHSFTTAAPHSYSVPLQEQLLAIADSDGDGVLTSAEAAQVEVLNISAQGISSLAGIEHFPNLRELYASDNQIRDLGPILRHTNLGTQEGSIIDLSENELGQYCGQINQLVERTQKHGAHFYWQNQKEILAPVSPRMWPKANVLDLTRGIKAIRGGDLCAE